MSVSMLRRLGIILTVLYVGMIVWFFTTRSADDQLWNLAPNNLGDTLAGTAGPLAFIWLVLGFFIQSKQLEAQSESVKAQLHAITMQREELELQREELRLQREEVARLASETEKQRTAIEATELNARRDVFFREFDLIRQEIDRAVLQILIVVDGKRPGKLYHYIGVTDSGGIKSRYLAGERELLLDVLVTLCIGTNSDWFLASVKQVVGEPVPLKRVFDQIEQVFEQAFDCDPTGRLRRFFEFSNIGDAYFALSTAYKWETKFKFRETQ